MGWNWNSRMYFILWLYFALDIIVTHFGVLNEEKINREKFGSEYEDYMKRVPRYV
jgi:protein-S-isoprenylcysteine O-methyltransferase Ste14